MESSLVCIDEGTQFWRGAAICLESVHVELVIISRILILSFLHLVDSLEGKLHLIPE